MNTQETAICKKCGASDSKLYIPEGDVFTCLESCGGDEFTTQAETDALELLGITEQEVEKIKSQRNLPADHSTEAFLAAYARGE